MYGKDVDKKRQKKRKDGEVYKVVEDHNKEKFYILDMFPYPSGAGIHVGHPKGYMASDAIARKKMLEGYNVLHPMGFDTFGLGTENYAIKMQMKPQDIAKQNIEYYIQQLEMFGTTYDRSRLINTADPKYYKWTQAIFLKMYNHYYDETENKAKPISELEKKLKEQYTVLLDKGGAEGNNAEDLIAKKINSERLAYVDYKPINRCPSCMTGLANEDLDDGKCERCASPVEQKPMKQRVLRITKYADRLLSGLDELTRDESMKDLERNRIGKSEGTEFKMNIIIPENETDNIGELSNKLDKENNDGTYDIIGLAMKVHKELGPGLQEKIYHKGLEKLLKNHGFKVESEKKIKYKIDGETIGYGSVDLLINNTIAIELKSRKVLEGDFYKQLRTYINQSKNINCGLLINFYNGKLEYKRLEKDYKKSNILGNFQKNSLKFFNVYTTRIDTVFGMSFVVLAPEHSLVDQITTEQFKKEVEQYKEQAKLKTQLERTELQKDKSGQFTGAYAINPFNGEKVPVYIADYVLANYGTGAVMAVPAHDERDFEFAKKYNIEIKQSIMPDCFDTKNPPRKDKKDTERNTIHVILRNTKNKTIMVHFLKGEQRGDLQPKNFIIGGIEDGESELDAAIREIKEETGYTNIKFIEQIPFKIQANFFAAHKDVNRKIHVNTLVFDIIGEEKVEITEDEHFTKDSHEQHWIAYEKIAETINIVDDKMSWKYFYEGGFAYTEKGILINSGEFSSMTSDEAIIAMQDRLEKNKLGGKKINYKMQDRVFSRQRYRGEPFPIVWTEDEKPIALDESELPLILPEIDNYQPTGTEEGPLADVDRWVNTTLKDGTKVRRETNTMPGWGGSSRYRLRYMDPNNDNELVSKENEKYRGNVDVYIGGAEHVTRHMIYARFWQKFLFDIGIVSKEEPFKEYHYVGLIMGEDGRKMSKRRGNVVNPDYIINLYGADTLRTYEMFMGPFDQTIARNTNGIKGVKKFLDKIIALKNNVNLTNKEDSEGNKKEDLNNQQTLTLLHQTIKKLTADIDGFRFNTAVSQLMILVNHLIELKEISKDTYEKLLIMVSPFAPHIAEEMRNQIGNGFSIFQKAKRPKYEEKYLISDTITLALQFNGKMRGTMQIKKDLPEENVINLIKSDEKLSAYLTGDIKKIIYVKGKIINIIL